MKGRAREHSDRSVVSLLHTSGRLENCCPCRLDRLDRLDRDPRKGEESRVVDKTTTRARRPHRAGEAEPKQEYDKAVRKGPTLVGLDHAALWLRVSVGGGAGSVLLSIVAKHLRGARECERIFGRLLGGVSAFLAADGAPGHKWEAGVRKRDRFAAQVRLPRNLGNQPPRATSGGLIGRTPRRPVPSRTSS